MPKINYYHLVTVAHPQSTVGKWGGRCYKLAHKFLLAKSFKAPAFCVRPPRCAAFQCGYGSASWRAWKIKKLCLNTNFSCTGGHIHAMSAQRVVGLLTRWPELFGCVLNCGNRVVWIFLKALYFEFFALAEGDEFSQLRLFIRFNCINTLPVKAT